MTKLLKKACGAFLCVTVLFGLAACGNGKGNETGQQPTAATNMLDPQKPVTITLWHYYEGDLQNAFDELVSQFNLGPGLDAGVVVNAVSMGSITNLEESITSSAKGVINADPLPELFFSYPDKAIEIDGLTSLVDLYTFFTEEELADYIPSFLKEGHIGERLVVLPTAKSTEVLYLNATAWDAFCAATGHTDASLATWEGVYAAAESYYEWSGGEMMFGIDTLSNFIVVGNRQLGVEVLSAQGGEGAVQLDSAAMRKIFDIYYNATVLGYFGEKSGFRSNDVTSGDIIGYVGSSSGASYFPTKVEADGAETEIEFRALMYPGFAGGTPYTVQQGAGICVVAGEEASVQASALFLKWFTSVEPNVTYALETGYLPVTASAYASETLANGLEELLSGTGEQTILGRVYEVGSKEILDGNAYFATAFDGSYSARRQLQFTLADIVAEDLEKATALREQGQGSGEILENLGTDIRFEDWLNAIRTELGRLGIPVNG